MMILLKFRGLTGAGGIVAGLRHASPLNLDSSSFGDAALDRRSESTAIEKNSCLIFPIPGVL
jgi:hypothetical protein